jgi:hypothetical protein
MYLAITQGLIESHFSFVFKLLYCILSEEEEEKETIEHESKQTVRTHR